MRCDAMQAIDSNDLFFLPESTPNRRLDCSRYRLSPTIRRGHEESIDECPVNCPSDTRHMWRCRFVHKNAATMASEHHQRSSSPCNFAKNGWGTSHNLCVCKEPVHRRLHLSRDHRSKYMRLSQRIHGVIHRNRSSTSPHLDAARGKFWYDTQRMCEVRLMRWSPNS